jgi:4,5-DOPA dioxygenase extradiol
VGDVTSIFDPRVPAGAFDEFCAHAAPVAARRRGWTPEDGALPAFYLSHGAPPLLDDTGWMRELFGWAESYPQPRGILVISAHWETAPLALSASAANTPLVYDFGGFAPRYYTLRYETPDAGELARLVQSVLPDGERAHEHSSRGLDHGAWVPLKVMYPNADVPVLQLSLPTDDPAQLLELGARLRPLREHGVLLIGSGFMTHGLPFLTRAMIERNEVPGWSREFAEWAREALRRGAVDELADYRSRAPGMPYAHPTVEHLDPLFVTLGAAGNPEAPREIAIDGYWMGLAKTSFAAA